MVAVHSEQVFDEIKHWGMICVLGENVAAVAPNRLQPHLASNCELLAKVGLSSQQKEHGLMLGVKMCHRWSTYMLKVKSIQSSRKIHLYHSHT